MATSDARMRFSASLFLSIARSQSIAVFPFCLCRLTGRIMRAAGGVGIKRMKIFLTDADSWEAIIAARPPSQTLVIARKPLHLRHPRVSAPAPPWDDEGKGLVPLIRRHVRRPWATAKSGATPGPPLGLRAFVAEKPNRRLFLGTSTAAPRPTRREGMISRRHQAAGFGQRPQVKIMVAESQVDHRHALEV